MTSPRLIAFVSVAGLIGLRALTAEQAQQPAPQPQQVGQPSQPLASQPQQPASADALWHHRNLGKAFYENPTTQAQAVDEFKKALDLAPDSARERLNYGLALLRAGRVPEALTELQRVQQQDPKIPHTWFNLGIAYKKDQQYEKAIAQFERLITLAPNEPVAHYNLGYLYKLTDKPTQALAEYERAATLDSNLAGPHFQLFNAYRDAGRETDAAREQATFQAIKRRQAGAAIPEDLDWSIYAEILDTLDPQNATDNTPPATVTFTDTQLAASIAAPPAAATLAAPPAAAPGTAPSRDARRAAFDPDHGGLLVLDADGDGRPDLLAWSATGIRLFKNGQTPVEPSVLAELTSLTNIRSIAAGDYNNDGLPDLCVLTDTGATLYTNTHGTFTKSTIALPTDTTGTSSFTKAVWLDYDHDYDADLLLIGDRPMLLRNNGPAGFSDQTADFPFAPGHALDAVVFGLLDSTSTHDVLITYADRNAVLYRDKLAGKYEPTPIDSLRPGARNLLAQDLDADGMIDIIADGTPGLTILLNRTDHFEPAPALAASPLTPTPAAGAAAAPALAASAAATPTRAVALADFENRALTDLIANGQILRNAAAGRFAAPATRATQATTAAALASVTTLANAAALATADFNEDGRIDIAAIAADGSLHLLRNDTRTPHTWVTVTLTGIKNPKLAPQAQVEVKAGASYQKQTYEGVPLLFGLRDATQIDTVRITWPNGLIQNEMNQPVGRALTYKEAQRLSGSCPMIFTWNGRAFQFITDVLGVAPLGASSGDGTYFPVDHDEYVQIPGEALAPQRDRHTDGPSASQSNSHSDSHYEIRITEELREVSYLDHVQLIAADHPASLDLFTNDKFKSPPFPEFRLFGAAARIHPLTARDDAGRDVSAALLKTDGIYPTTFSRDYSGVADLHTLNLDFGKAARDNRAVLILRGWVDWADGSTFLAAAQTTSEGLVMPKLQVKDTAGRWQTVIEDMGLPAGKPKTIAVDLTGKFLSASREVRIVTSLCIYWDEIFLSEQADPPPVHLTSITASAADLHFRGFSTPTIDPARLQPESFDYARVTDLSMWNPTSGLYTRYGDVLPLVTAIDDELIIMGSGDELRLQFPTASLPPLPADWKRDFLLLVDGWAKDADANTAFGQSVDPLPFHAMSAYPYRASEHFPNDASHRQYREHYNTRPALRLIRPLRAPRQS